MRNQRTTFLAGVAALALVAGTGFASAQETSQDHKGAAQPHASTPAMKTEHGGGTVGQAPSGGKMGETQGAGQKAKGTDRMAPSTAQQGAGTSAKEPNQRVQEMNPANKTDKGKMGEDRAINGERTKTGAPTTAEERREGGPNTAGRENDRLKGLQGNASGVTFNEEQRTRLRETVINARGAPRVGSVDFDLSVGTAIPRGRIEIVPVPEMLVQIQPEWRGFLYFVFRDELVIVDPSDMRIVAVVPV
jgi:hypothetical protein